MPSIAESYALQSGLKIGKPFILDKFWPLPFKDYIVLQADAKFESRRYDHWNEVITLLRPVLDKHNITIVSVGVKGEKIIPNTYSLVGQGNVHNFAYVIKNAKLVFGVDSLSAHMAGAYDVPIVTLYPNMYARNSRPAWGNKDKQILIEPNRRGLKPSFSANENPKTINFITPEEIASSVCKLLGVDFHTEYQTVFFAPLYNQPRIELIPNQVIDDIKVFGINSLIVRMDFLFNENVLLAQLQRNKCSIITNRPINLNLLGNLRQNITEFVYEIKDDSAAEYLKQVQKLGVPVIMVSYLPEEQIKQLKLKYFEIGIIIKREHLNKNNFAELNNSPNYKLYYKSGKRYLASGKIFPSLAALNRGKNIESLSQDFEPVIDSPEFWMDMEHYYFATGPERLGNLSEITI